MPLTRHFYASEEVLSSLLYTTSKGVTKESVFWCHELIHSGYASEAIGCIFESWVWHHGAFAIGWYLCAWDRLSKQEVSSDDLLQEVCHLSSCSKDTSVWNLLAGQAYAPSERDRVTPRSPALFPSEDPKEIFFIRAIYQHKSQSAWWIAQWISEERYFVLLEWYREHVVEESVRSEIGRFFCAIRSYDLLLGYQSAGYDKVVKVLMLLSLCLTQKQRERSLMAPKIQGIQITEWVDDWTGKLGTLSARVCAIPYYSLYGTWGRGRMLQTKTSVHQLFDVEKGMKGCPFWDDVLVQPFEKCEAYFPDDLPDEWMKSEKEKSHGSGLLRANETVNLWGYTKRYMKRSHLVWNRGQWNQEKRIRFFEDIVVEVGDTPFQRLLSLMESVPLPEEPLDTVLLPVHKRKVVRE